MQCMSILAVAFAGWFAEAAGCGGAGQCDEARADRPATQIDSNRCVEGAEGTHVEYTEGTVRMAGCHAGPAGIVTCM